MTIVHSGKECESAMVKKCKFCDREATSGDMCQMCRDKWQSAKALAAVLRELREIIEKDGGKK